VVEDSNLLVCGRLTGSEVLQVHRMGIMEGDTR
jgi:hypothetical protein